MSDNSADYSLVWVNLQYHKWGDGQLHMSSQKEIANCCSAAFLMDTFPQETFDGFWCINESSKGKNNFRNICKFFSQQEDGENTLLKLFRENNGENLMRHPLLCMKNTELLNNELKKDLEQIKCFVVNKDYASDSQPLMFYSNKMRELLKNI
jgi:hypothetical protein